MSQRRSYNSNDFNMDDLFRPEPGPEQQGGTPPPHQEYPPQPPEYQPPQYQSVQTGSFQTGPEYWGPAAQQPQYGEPAPEAGTQMLPPYPAAQPQPSYGGAYGAVPPPPQYAPTPQPEAARRPPMGLIVGGAVAGVAVVALIGYFAFGDDGSDNGKPVAKPSTAVTVTASGSAAPGGLTPEAKAQAQKISDLLGGASASRTAVGNAVANVGQCKNVPDAQAALTQAAAQRNSLVTQVSALKADQLPGGPDLIDALKAAWTASATADSEYAAWAGDLAQGCDAAKKDDHYTNAGNASGQATTAKNKASQLWNAIAQQASLPTKSSTEL